MGDAIKDAVKKKPKDLFEFVAQQLQERSGINPADFEREFEESRQRPRDYILEERCPASQDPLTWVPMRYNDDTILLTLQQRAAGIIGDILCEEGIEDFKAACDALVVAFPEVMYLRDSDQEILAFQVLKAVYLGCMGCKGDEFKTALDDADPRLSFRCESLVAGARAAALFEAAVRGEDMVDALLVACLLHLLGRHEGFRERYGGGHMSPEGAVLHAIDHESKVLPSYQRLSEQNKRLVSAVLQATFPLEMLVTSEIVPAHFGVAKDMLVSLNGGMGFFVSYLLVEHMASSRNILVTDDDVDLVRLSMQCLAAVEKYGPQRAYELFLKKRAERHAWRLTKDDFLHRAIVRLCCFAGLEDSDAWQQMMASVESLSHAEAETLKNELGHKDGMTDCPAFILVGAGAMMSKACSNATLGAEAGVKMLVRILADVAKTHDKSQSHKVIQVHVEEIVDLANRFRPGGAPFEDTPIVLEDLGMGEVAVHVP